MIRNNYWSIYFLYCWHTINVHKRVNCEFSYCIDVYFLDFFFESLKLHKDENYNSKNNYIEGKDENFERKSYKAANFDFSLIPFIKIFSDQSFPLRVCFYLPIFSILFDDFINIFEGKEGECSINNNERVDYNF